MIRLVIVFGAVLALASESASQQPKSPPHSISATPAKLALAREMVDLMNVAYGSEAATAHIPAPTSQPTTAFGRSTVRATAQWMQKYLPPDSMKAIRVRVIASEFTEAELRDLLAFYRSPIGQRFVKAQPALIRGTNTAISRLLDPHRAELRDALHKVAANIDSI